ncbi:MAG TPA: hypothetical protein VHO70_14410 [Chitinispirillaceae bacterium]|nr:hypothetical protein [Chitinispirillaceae bacterium]
MKKGANKATVLRNGQRQQNIKEVRFGAEEYRGEVPTMDGMMTVDKIPTKRFSIVYVIPRENAKHDWSDIKDETWIFDIHGVKRVTYIGVDSLQRGEATLNGEGESSYQIDFIAEKVIIE